MICVDANIVIALLSSDDEWNEAAMAEFVRSDGFKVLTVTRAEAMVRLYRTGQVDVANGLLDEYGIESELEVLTTDDTWPTIPDASIRVLTK